MIDEFNPTDFEWPETQDYSLKEIEDKFGEAFRFFKMLTGLAYTSNGFVVFVGTRDKAFARALHKINGGTKAQLSRCTIIPGHDSEGSFPFSAWRGFVWSADDKAKVVRDLYGSSYKDLLLEQGMAEHEAGMEKEMVVMNLCSRDDNIRSLCIYMQDAVRAKEAETGPILQKSYSVFTKRGVLRFNHCGRCQRISQLRNHVATVHDGV